MFGGFFITFEGVEGCGKSTQILRLRDYLEQAGHELLLTREPGGTPIAEAIRKVLLDPQNEAMSVRTELLLYEAARAQHVHEKIRPALDAGKIVLCDRFTDSSEAYQGGGRELGSAMVLNLHRLVCGEVWPDLTILLLPGFEPSLKRARRRNKREEKQTGKNEGRFEAEQDAFFRRVWEKYREIAAREPGRVALIEGDLGIDEVFEQVVEIVSERLVVAGLLPSRRSFGRDPRVPESG